MIDLKDVQKYLAQGQDYQSKADYENAEKSYLLALEIAMELEAETSLVAEALRRLTGFYSALDQYDDAIAQAAWAIQIIKKRLGEEHPDLAAFYSNLADLHRCQGNEEESRKYEGLAGPNRN
jgi:tetratricopeptide (TPR) repeat protein